MNQQRREAMAVIRKNLKSHRDGKMSEADIGEVVKSYLSEAGQEVYCEVDTGAIGRIDIIAVSGRIITAVELKVHLSLEVLGQAIDRRYYVHRSIAAFPRSKHSGYRGYVLKAVHVATGIGIWEVSNGYVRELYPPLLNRKARSERIVESLDERQKHQAAGVSCGYWSPFRDTKYALVEFVRKHPGCTLKDTMTGIEHHYKTHSTAYSSMAKWIHAGVIKEVELRDGLLYLKEIAP